MAFHFSLFFILFVLWKGNGMYSQSKQDSIVVSEMGSVFVVSHPQGWAHGSKNVPPIGFGFRRRETHIQRSDRFLSDKSPLLLAPPFHAFFSW